MIDEGEKRMNDVAQLSMEELLQIIDRVVEQKLRGLLGPTDTRSLDEVLASIDRHMWTPPPGAKSPTEMLREDRDR